LRLADCIAPLVSNATEAGRREFEKPDSALARSSRRRIAAMI